MNQMSSLLVNSLECIKYLDPRKIDVRRLTGLSQPLPSKIEKVEMEQLLGSCRHIIRLAGLFGASAVVLGAYGAHTLMTQKDEKYDDAKKVFDTANRYHFYHSIALLGAPFSHYPKVTTSFLVVGMVLFCGPCYLQSLKNDSRFRQVTPYGGGALILAWISLLL